MKSKIILSVLTAMTFGLFIAMVPQAEANETSSSFPAETMMAFPPQSVTGSYTGELDKELLEPPFILVQATDFEPTEVVIDIIDGGPKTLHWAVGVINLTTEEVIVPPIYHLHGVKQMNVSLNDLANKNDVLSVYMVPLLGKGDISVRATLIP